MIIIILPKNVCKGDIYLPWYQRLKYQVQSTPIKQFIDDKTDSSFSSFLGELGDLVSLNIKNDERFIPSSSFRYETIVCDFPLLFSNNLRNTNPFRLIYIACPRNYHLAVIFLIVCILELDKLYLYEQQALLLEMVVITDCWLLVLNFLSFVINTLFDYQSRRNQHNQLQYHNNAYLEGVEI